MRLATGTEVKRMQRSGSANPKRPRMTAESAAAIKPGDTVNYNHEPRKVLAVEHDRERGPIFTLDQSEAYDSPLFPWQICGLA